MQEMWLSVELLSSKVGLCSIELVVKGKDRPRTGHEGPEEEKRYSFTLSLASALDGGGWLTPSLSYHGPLGVSCNIQKYS
jgi:hypothetical protein